MAEYSFEIMRSRIHSKCISNSKFPKVIPIVIYTGKGKWTSETILKNIQEEVTNYVSENTDEIMQTTVGVASSVLGTITSLVLGIVFAIYILLKKEDLSRQSKKILKAYLPEKREKRIREICEVSNTTFGNFISGQCLEALIIGILCFFQLETAVFLFFICNFTRTLFRHIRTRYC